MTATPGHVFRQILIDAGLVVPPGIREIRDDPFVQGFVDFTPDEINNCVRVNNMASALWGHNQRSGRLLEHPQVLISVRHEDRDDGQDVARSVYNAVQTFPARSTVAVSYENSRGDEVSDSALVQSVYATTSLLSLGEEVGKKRFVWSFTARIAYQSTN